VALSSTVIIKRPDALSAAERAQWIAIRAQTPALYSPYFHPAYTELLGELRNDISVAIIYQDDQPVGFLPFQGPKTHTPGKHGHFAQPVGAPMTDYHGIISADTASFDGTQVLKQAGIGAFHFSALIDPSGCFADVIEDTQACAVIDLASDVAAWRAERDGSYKRHLKSQRRRVRKAEEQWGPRRIAFKSSDRAVFDQLITWKREKFAETGKYDVLSVDWTLAVLERLWGCGYKELSCHMQALYFGDHLAAIDLGLTDGPTFHSWIVAYDNQFHSLAPGIQLLEALIDAAPDLGYSRIDLGAGIDGYKRQYATQPVEAAAGFIATTGPAAALSRLYGAAEHFGESAPLGGIGRLPGKVRRRYSQVAACDDSFSGRARAMFDAVKTAGRA